MAIGKPSAPGESKYGYKLHKTIFKRKCPHCGSTDLYWGLWWNGSETSSASGRFPCTGKREGGSAEGHIFCGKCDADYGVVNGNEHINGSKYHLTVISGPVASSREEAYKLKNGQMPFNGESGGETGTSTETRTTTYTQGRLYTMKTDSNGIASLPITLGLGNYKVKTTVQADEYNTVIQNNTIDVVNEVVNEEEGVDESVNQMTYTNTTPSGSIKNGNYIWVRSGNFSSLASNLQTLKNNNIKHVLLNVGAIGTYGSNAVNNLGKTCSLMGMTLHIWMQMCYSGGSWNRAIKNGSLNTTLLNQKLAEARTYANMTGVGGIHLDYMRFPGDAYNYGVATACNAINTFVQQISSTARGVKSNIIMSGAIMPERDSSKNYYGQDVNQLSSYLDVFMPMAYVGNYKHTSDATSWLASTTKYYTQNCNGKAVWMGLQGYHSDSNLALWNTSTITEHARACLNAGAQGYGLFRYALTNYPKI